MDRRQFLAATAGAPLAGFASGCTPEGPPSTLPRTVGLNGARDSFGLAPSSIARRTRREHTALTLQPTHGAPPLDMGGHAFFQSLSMEHDDVGFGGDAMIWRFDLGAETRVTNRILRNADWHLYDGARGSKLAFLPRGVSRFGPLGLQNMANTALVPIAGNRLIATMDGGRPWEVDPATLEAVAPVGAIDDYRQVAAYRGFNELLAPLIISTAHPGYDPRNNEFFGLACSIVPGANFCDVMVWDGVARPSAVSLVTRAGRPVQIRQSAHQVCVTRHHVIVIDSGITFEAGKLTGNVTGAEAGWMQPPVDYTQLVIVPRSSLTGGASRAVATIARVPRESGHFFVDYDSSPDRCVVHLPHTPASDVGEWLLRSDRHPSTGLPVDPRLVGSITPLAYDQGVIARYELDTASGRIVSADAVTGDWLWGSGGLSARNPLTPDGQLGDVFYAHFGFPTNLAVHRADAAFRDYRHRIVPHDSMPWEGRPTALVRFDHDSLTLADGYSFAGDEFCWSIAFAPRNGTATGARDGYLLAIVYTEPQAGAAAGSGVEVWVFDAARLSSGPVCRLGHPDFDLPLTLHSTWLPHLTATRPAPPVDVAEELTSKARTWRTRPEVAGLVAEHIIPAFG